MITEDYVSYSIAKLLKEKGFNEYTYAYYLQNASFYLSPREIDNKNLYAQGCVSAPTLQMAMKWLREVHNQIIVPGIRLEDRTSGTINCYIAGIWYIPKNNGGAFCYTSPTPYNGYPSFEEACEAAIKYCLKNLI